MKTIQLCEKVLSLTILLTLATINHAQEPGSLFTVNSTADSNDASPGDYICADAANRCTLRAAVEESNVSSLRNAIVFDLPHPIVIDLALGELSVLKILDIVGPGARRLTIQRSMVAGTPNFRVFHVPNGRNILNMRGLTIRNGNAAGASGGGLLAGTESIVNLTDVAITGNHANAGGGIAAFGIMTVLRTLINSNVATDNGGALLNANGAFLTTITNSTITGNSANTSGAIDNNANLVLINNTISRNSATIAPSSIRSGFGGTVKVLNTILGRDASHPVALIEGAFQSAGNNIVTDSRGSSGFVNGINSDRVSENNLIDPLLGLLADNGGQTDTLALRSGSPAIDNGNNCAATGFCPQLPGMFIRGRTDQRRYPRLILFDFELDIGAYEAGVPMVTGTAPIPVQVPGSTGRFTG